MVALIYIQESKVIQRTYKIQRCFSTLKYTTHLKYLTTLVIVNQINTLLNGKEDVAKSNTSTRLSKFVPTIEHG